MPDTRQEMRCDARQWADLVVRLLVAGHRVPFRVNGVSMSPTLLDGDFVTLAGVRPSGVRKGDIIAFRRGRQLVLHRVLEVVAGPDGEPRFLTAGDGLLHEDGIQPGGALVGRVVHVQQGSTAWSPDAPLRRAHAHARVLLARHPRFRSVLRGAKEALRRSYGPWREIQGRAGAGS